MNSARFDWLDPSQFGSFYSWPHSSLRLAQADEEGSEAYIEASHKGGHI